MGTPEVDAAENLVLLSVATCEPILR